MAYKKKLTRKQAGIVRARVLDPLASQREIGVKVGMTQPHVARELAKPHVKAHIAELMDARPKLRLGSMLDRLEEGLESVELRSVRVVGENMKAEVEVADQGTRHKWWESAMKMRGALGPDASDAPVNGPVNIAIILAGGGSDQERTAISDVLVAARIARGLHITENRKMTEQEAEQYRRGA